MSDGGDLKLPSKSIVKEAFHRILLVVIMLTALLILPQRTMVTSAQTGSEQYLLTASPKYMPEGLSTNIAVNIREGEPNHSYSLSLEVAPPIGTSYYTIVIVKTINLGTGINYTKFWSDFAGANTTLAGAYKMYLYDEGGNTVAYSGFTVGLTDKLDYLRSENVNIHGSGYKANEKVLVDLTLGNASISGFPRPVYASAEGVVIDSWTIPANVSPGVYTVSLFNATTTVKPISDVQSFKVGAKCEVQTKNLAGESVANVTVEVYNATTSSLFDYQETNKTGWTRSILSPGNYIFKAFWRNVEVGVINQTVTENILLPITINLSNIGITVRDESFAALPFIDLRLKYNYTDRSNKTFSETESFNAKLAGYVQVQNVFANIGYIIEARRDGLLFNTTFIRNLSGSWNNITIIAPTYTMFVTVLDSKDAHAVGLKVAAYEWSSGISGEPLQLVQTDSDGNVTFSFTVGKYILRLYYGTTFLNEATVNLQNQTSLTIQCNVYNADLNVFVVDFLGQPIPNVSVELQRKNDSDYQTTQTKTTGPNGVASFDNIIGGDSRITVSLAGRTSKTQYLYLVGPTKDVVFKLDGYVMVAGYFLETIHFVTIIVLLILIVALILASTYKRLLRLLQKLRK